LQRGSLRTIAGSSSVPGRSKDDDSFIHSPRYDTRWWLRASVNTRRTEIATSRPRISLIKRKKARRPTARLAPTVAAFFRHPPPSQRSGLSAELDWPPFLSPASPVPSPLSLSLSPAPLSPLPNVHPSFSLAPLSPNGGNSGGFRASEGLD